MNILFATFRYLSFTGTETFSYTMLEQLSKNGHKVFFYSPFCDGKILQKSKRLNVFFSNNLEDYKKEKIDVIHCQHNLTSILLRYHFPKTPMVYLMHGPYSYLEQAPDFIDFNYYGAISLEIKDKLSKQKIPLKKIFYFPNSIDTTRFKPSNPLPQWPQNLLVLSNYLNKEGEKTIKSVAKDLKLKLKFLGKNKTKFDVEKDIKEADIVMSLGRGIIEAMSCGKAALVFSYKPGIYEHGDGMVSKDNVDSLAKNNFSGRTRKIPFNKENIIKELEKYRPEMGEFNRKYALNSFNISKNIKIIEKIYEKAIKEPAGKYDHKQVNFIAQGIEVLLAYEKLAYRYRDFDKLLFTRFKDQVINK